MRVKNFKKTFNTFFRAGIKIILLFLLVSGAGVRGFAADRIMLFSPHEDDETIACAGIINRAVERGDEIFVVMVLNGDSHGGVIKAQIRIERTIAAMEVLGLSKDHILYLGYADGRVLGNAWQNPGEIFTSSDGITIETYGFPEDQYPHIGIEDYHYTTYGEHALYTRENISTDFTNLLNEYQPDVIFSPAPIEVHADHSSVGLFLTEALVQIGTNPANTYTPLVYEYLIYKQRLPQDTQDPTEPVLNTEANMDATPYAWLNRVSYAVPEEMTLPFESNLKYEAYVAYGGYAMPFTRFIKSDEIFWKKRTGSISYQASVTASSENEADDKYCANVIDGFALGYPWRNEAFYLYDKEWIPAGETNGAWVELSWDETRTVSSVVLYDRPNTVQNIAAGTLSFSDGSSITLGALPHNGSPCVVEFPPKTIDSVRFTIDEAAGSEVGISEFEVYPARVKNIAPDASVAVSSESSSTSQTGLKAIDGKTGGYPGNYREEWASQNEVSGAWISLSWNVNRTINSVVLYDRPNPLDNINGALLEFSDGSTIEVGSLPEDGSAHTITFDAKTVSWVKLNISDAEGVNVGLAEMQVFGYPLEEGYGNIAPFSRVLVSSQGSAQAGIKAIDEEKDGYPGDYSREWSTRSETAGAWITLEWERTFSVDSVILYDRPNSSDNITSGSLLFSDGSSVSVGTLPNNGSGHIINFPAREIKWVKLVIDEAAGHNTGLSEIEVFGVSVD